MGAWVDAHCFKTKKVGGAWKTTVLINRPSRRGTPAYGDTTTYEEVVDYVAKGWNSRTFQAATGCLGQYQKATRDKTGAVVLHKPAQPNGGGYAGGFAPHNACSMPGCTRPRNMNSQHPTCCSNCGNWDHDHWCKKAQHYGGGFAGGFPVCSNRGCTRPRNMNSNRTTCCSMCGKHNHWCKKC